MDNDKPKGNFFNKVFGRKQEVEEEIVNMLEQADEDQITEEGKKMINSIFEFDDKLAYEIMTPRTDVFMIDLDDKPEEYIDKLLTLKHSRIPVCKGDNDNIIGILHIKDYLIKLIQDKKEQIDIEPLLREAYFVPETKNIDNLFFEMQRAKHQIAILIDEYGGFSGIVTLEDIIEQIVGDIDDEFDEEEEVIEKVDDNCYIVDGDVSLDDLSKELNCEIDSENSETVGGLVIEALGEIPNNESIGKTVTIGNLAFEIVEVSDRRIERIKIIQKEA